MDLNEWVQWMTIVGAVFTVIASITAITGIYTWLVESYDKKHPFKFDYANYDDVTEDVPVIHVHFTNHVNRTITIKHSELMTKRKYSLSESNGELASNSTYGYRTHGNQFDPKPVTFMERTSFTFKLDYEDPREVRRVMAEAKNLMLITTSGEWYIPIKYIRKQRHEVMDISYYDVAYSKFGKWRNYLRYIWWKHCLSEETQKEFIRFK